MMVKKYVYKLPLDGAICKTLRPLLLDTSKEDNDADLDHIGSVTSYLCNK